MLWAHNGNSVLRGLSEALQEWLFADSLAEPKVLAAGVLILRIRRQSGISAARMASQSPSGGAFPSSALLSGILTKVGVYDPDDGVGWPEISAA